MSELYPSPSPPPPPPPPPQPLQSINLTKNHTCPSAPTKT